MNFILWIVLSVAYYIFLINIVQSNQGNYFIYIFELSDRLLRFEPHLFELALMITRSWFFIILNFDMLFVVLPFIFSIIVYEYMFIKYSPIILMNSN